MHTITKYDKFFLNSRNCDIYTIHRGDNNCESIKVGDRVKINEELFVVKQMEEFEKSFGIRGDNVSLILEKI
jgi:ribosomal protein S17